MKMNPNNDTAMVDHKIRAYKVYPCFNNKKCGNFLRKPDQYCPACYSEEMGIEGTYGKVK